jgi:uncharacterized membrane protein (DUF485 family)
MNQSSVIAAEHNTAHSLARQSYRQLVIERRRLAWGLSAFVLVVYYAFIYVVAFKPAWLAMRLGHSSMSVGLLVAAGMFVMFTTLTAYYSHRANRRFDALTRLAIKEMSA